MSIQLHFHLMAKELSQALMTRPFESGMHKQDTLFLILCKITQVVSIQLMAKWFSHALRIMQPRLQMDGSWGQILNYCSGFLQKIKQTLQFFQEPWQYLVVNGPNWTWTSMSMVHTGKNVQNYVISITLCLCMNVYYLTKSTVISLYPYKFWNGILAYPLHLWSYMLLVKYEM